MNGILKPESDGLRPPKSRTAMKATSYNVCLFNSADPRGLKVGGIETYTRDYIFYHPSDMNLLFIGADEIGDLKIGELNDVEFRGRNFKFLPLYYLANSVNVYPNRISSSETFHFASQLVKNFRKLRKILREGDYTAEIRRVEYAPILKAMGVPFIQMVHVWGAPNKPMSSLMGKYWYLRSAAELLAAAFCRKFYSVNSDMTTMYKKSFHWYANKFDTLTTWANTSIFNCKPYQFRDDKIRIVYAGRMDNFKRPDIMFKVMAAVDRLSGGRLEFNYIGDGNPTTIPEFAAIKDKSVLHGRHDSVKLAEIMSQMHLGVLTSEFEGMPRVVLEVLATGRPMVSLHLPQLECVIRDGVNGWLIPRGDGAVELQAARLVEAYQAMRAGRMTPEGVATSVAPFRPQLLLDKIFADHRQLHGLPTLSSTAARCLG